MNAPYGGGGENKAHFRQRERERESYKMRLDIALVPKHSGASGSHGGAPLGSPQKELVISYEDSTWL